MILGKCSYTKNELDILGKELLEWIKVDGNWYLKEWLSFKDIPFEYVDVFSKTSAVFKQHWQLATQIMESKLVKELKGAKSGAMGIISILKNACAWEDKSEVKNKVEIDVSPENLERILQKRLSKRDKFNTDCKAGIAEDWREKLLIKADENTEDENE
jgi:hypothetical protein